LGASILTHHHLPYSAFNVKIMAPGMMPDLAVYNWMMFHIELGEFTLGYIKIDCLAMAEEYVQNIYIQNISIYIQNIYILKETCDCIHVREKGSCPSNVEFGNYRQ
jgi:hypothetical protein